MNLRKEAENLIILGGIPCLFLLGGAVIGSILFPNDGFYGLSFAAGMALVGCFFSVIAIVKKLLK